MITERYPFSSQHSLIGFVPSGFSKEQVVQSYVGPNHLFAYLLSQAGAIYQNQCVVGA